jgi:hypothetical protein
MPEMLDIRAYLTMSDSSRRDPPNRVVAGGAVEELVITYLGFWFGGLSGRRRLGCGTVRTAQVEALQEPEQIQSAREGISASVGMLERARESAAGLAVHLDDHPHEHFSRARRLSMAPAWWARQRFVPGSTFQCG